MVRGEPGGLLFGLARNDRLVEEIKAELAEAAAESAATEKPARRFATSPGGRWTDCAVKGSRSRAAPSPA